MKRLATACVLTAALLAPAASHAQDQPIATVDRPTPVASFGGRVIWSTLNQATGNWSLVTRAGGVTQTVPVAPRRVAFDADLGPGPDGGVVAVYSRCAQDPPPGSGFAPTLYNRGRGCDIWMYDFATGTERRLANASSPSATEFFPTIWRNTLAFGRVYDNKPDLPYIYTRPVNGTATSTRQPGGRRNACTRNRSTGRTACTPIEVNRPMSLELYGRRLAFTWTFNGGREGLNTEIRLDTIGGGHTRVATQNGGGLTQVQLGWPAFEAGQLYWAQACFGDPSGCPGRFGLWRYRITTRETTSAPAPAAMLSHDRDAGVDLLLVDTMPGVDCMGDPPVAGGTCRLSALTPAFG
jgi:opacity protein-like surface antigen